MQRRCRQIPSLSDLHSSQPAFVAAENSGFIAALCVIITSVSRSLSDKRLWTLSTYRSGSIDWPRRKHLGRFYDHGSATPAPSREADGLHQSKYTLWSNNSSASIIGCKLPGAARLSASPRHRRTQMLLLLNSERKSFYSTQRALLRVYFC